MNNTAKFNKFSKPLKFIKNNKRKLLIGTGVVGTAGLGYGGYKLHQNKDRIVKDVGFKMIEPTVKSASREFANEFFKTPQMKKYIAKKQNQFDNLIGQGNNKFNKTISSSNKEINKVKDKAKSQIDKRKNQLKGMI